MGRIGYYIIIAVLMMVMESQAASVVGANPAITPGTKTKVTYDAKGLVTAGADATTADIADSSNKRYVTDAQLTVIGNTSGTNTGDQTNIVGNAGTATALQTGRTIGMSGPINWISPGFNGSGDVTAAATVSSQTGTGSTFAMQASPSFTGFTSTNGGFQTTFATPSLSFSASKLMCQMEDGNTARCYIVGADSSTYGTNIFYTAKSSGSPIKIFSYGPNGVTASGGSANTVVCWKADGETLGYATVAEITGGTCH